MEDLTTPALFVDLGKLKSNCDKMLRTAEDLNVTLRPHMKTHKTIEGGVLMTGGSKRRIVVSTLAEAEFYANGGFDDILYAFPLTPDKIPRCAKIMARLSTFHILVDNHVIVDALMTHTSANPGPWSVYVKVDCGNNRAGIFWENVQLGIDLTTKMQQSNGRLRFAGIYSHCGDSYRSSVLDVASNTVDRLRNFADRLKGAGIDVPSISLGSTPVCSSKDQKMRLVDEIHPGNYVFYDAQQYTLGSCKLEEIAVTVATRVIGHYPHRNQLLIDCGFAALTKQGMNQMPSGCAIFRDAPELKLLDMTQEIGKVTTIDGKPLQLEKYPIGRVLHLFPWHSCATAMLYDKYLVVDNGKITTSWQTCRGW